jgi:hypothetical protein
MSAPCHAARSEAEYPLPVGPLGFAPVRSRTCAVSRSLYMAFCNDKMLDANQQALQHFSITPQAAGRMTNCAENAPTGLELTMRMNINE